MLPPAADVVGRGGAHDAAREVVDKPLDEGMHRRVGDEHVHVPVALPELHAGGIIRVVGGAAASGMPNVTAFGITLAGWRLRLKLAETLRYATRRDALP